MIGECVGVALGTYNYLLSAFVCLCVDSCKYSTCASTYRRFWGNDADNCECVQDTVFWNLNSSWLGCYGPVGHT